MAAFLMNLEAWHWLSAGILLLLLEVLGAAGFLLGLGLGALCVALLMALVADISWQWQFTIFALMSVLCTVAYWRYFRDFNQATDQPLLNNRVAALMGQRAAVVEVMAGGRCKVQIQDALWSASCADTVSEGDAVTIVAANGMDLVVEPVR